MEGLSLKKYSPKGSFPSAFWLVEQVPGIYLALDNYSYPNHSQGYRWKNHNHKGWMIGCLTSLQGKHMITHKSDVFQQLQNQRFLTRKEALSALTVYLDTARIGLA